MKKSRLDLRPLRFFSAAAAVGLLPGALAGDAATAIPPGFLADASSRTEAALDRADLAAYRGWLKYLRLDAQSAAGGDAAAKARRLDDWERRIAADPQVLANLRGVQEWAYESPADDSGQPFRIDIPTDYDPAHPAPLTVYMHGYSCLLYTSRCV